MLERFYWLWINFLYGRKKCGISQRKFIFVFDIWDYCNKNLFRFNIFPKWRFALLHNLFALFFFSNKQLNSYSSTCIYLYFSRVSTHFIKLDSFSIKVSNSADSTLGISPVGAATGAAATGAGSSLDPESLDFNIAKVMATPYPPKMAPATFFLNYIEYNVAM